MLAVPQDLSEQQGDNVGTIYLIHFERPFGHAQHYLGWTKDLDARMVKHRKGNGSKLMAAVSKAGIRWAVVQTWLGDRHLERKLKNQGSHCKKCWICKAYNNSTK